MLGVSKGLGPQPHESWGWNEEVQIVIKDKRECWRKFPKAEDGESLKNPRELRKKLRRQYSKAREEALDGLYQKRGTREGEKEMFKLA